MTHNDSYPDRKDVQRCPWCGSSFRQMLGDDLWWQCGSRTSRQSWGCREVVALRAERDELRKATQDALAFASVLQQQLGWARSKSPELSRELEQQERDAYRLFDTCWDALKMKPEATRAT